MKKKLEADLISIAHRILQLKNKSDINQLYLETQKLYEKLAVLQFVENHFGEQKPTIGLTEVSQELETIFEEKTAEATTSIEQEIPTTIVLEETSVAHVSELIDEEPTHTEIEEERETKVISETQEEEKEATAEEIVALESVEEAVIASTSEEIIATTIAAPDVVVTPDFIPSFSLLADEVEDTPAETIKKPEAVQISFEDLLGGNYHDTLFVKKQQVENIPTAVVIETPTATPDVNQTEANVAPAENNTTETKPVSLNDKLAKGIHIDLNDRLAFIKHLFANSSDDYNRVLSQINTFKTFYETRDFVQEMVKPDYNNWEGKQEYEDRFMEIIEKKFL